MSGKVHPFSSGRVKDLTTIRMILYFPVSALMTLFANILNNPLDPRAKSDIRLLNLVVTFLSMLGQEAEQGGVHRMLGVCAEFERIAKSVIEKAEKDQSSRRKRKNQDAKDAAKSSGTGTKPNGASSRPTVPATTPSSNAQATPRTAESGLNTTTLTAPPTDPSLAYSPMSNISGHSPAMPHGNSSNLQQYQQQQFSMPATGGDFGDFDSWGFPTGDSPGSSNMAPTAFHQQPLLPPDLFSLPMNLDWNWAELSGGAYPTVENGNFSDRLSETQGDHGQQQQQQQQQ